MTGRGLPVLRTSRVTALFSFENNPCPFPYSSQRTALQGSAEEFDEAEALKPPRSPTSSPGSPARPLSVSTSGPPYLDNSLRPIVLPPTAPSPRSRPSAGGLSFFPTSPYLPPPPPSPIPPSL